MATVTCEPMQLQRMREDLHKARAETQAIKLDAQAKLAAENQKLKSTEARCATLEAYLHHETAKADRCWSRAEALEEANIALKKEVELLKREKSQLHSDLKRKHEREDSRSWSQLQNELKHKDELIIYAVETRNARKRSQADLRAKLELKEDELKNTEARYAALEANLHQEFTQAQETWSRNLEALENDNAALKEKVQLLKSAQSQLELTITKIEERQAHSKPTIQTDSMVDVTNKEVQSTEDECEVTLKTPEASQELPQSEEECGSEAELPQSEGGCSSEMQQLVILNNVKVEHETEESEHKSSNQKAKNNKQLHQKKKKKKEKKRRSRRAHSFY